MPPYKYLASYYDRVFGFAHSWGGAARAELLKEILPRIGSACDLACGTGTTALELARGGIRMCAVDLSPTMCELAAKKARAARLPVHVIQADMRTFRLPEPVELVTCEFDALNHVPRKSDLARVANAVSRALEPGGHFYFDVNNRLAFERAWPLTWWIEKPGVVVVMRGGYDRANEKAFADVEWFIRDGPCWRRRHERVEEVCWTPAEIRAALREAGFGQIRRWDATPLFAEDPLLRPGYRTFYLARKNATSPRAR